MIEKHDIDGWSFYVRGPDRPPEDLSRLSRYVATVVYWARMLGWRIWGRHMALLRERRSFDETVGRWYELAGLTEEQQEIQRRVRQNNRNAGGVSGREYTPDDYRVGYGSDGPTPSSVEPHDQRMERLRAVAASRPRPPLVDDGGLVWKLVRLEDDLPPVAKKSASRKRSRSRGKSHR